MLKFDELINSGQPVLVDFYADWCGPCKVMAPVLKQAVTALENKVKIIKVDVDKNQAAAGHYGVQAIPTLILFKGGEIKWRQAGAVPLNQLLDAVKKFI